MRILRLCPHIADWTASKSRACHSFSGGQTRPLALAAIVMLTLDLVLILAGGAEAAAALALVNLGCLCWMAGVVCRVRLTAPKASLRRLRREADASPSSPGSWFDETMGVIPQKPDAYLKPRTASVPARRILLRGPMPPVRPEPSSPRLSRPRSSSSGRPRWGRPGPSDAAC